MKIAVTGKGGVGKTTLAAGLARAFGRRGKKVVALDVDPSPNLLLTLGAEGEVPEEKLVPLMERSSLIQERTGAPPEGYGLVFKLNPKVDDLVERFGIRCRDGVRLLVVGKIRRGGQGCFCPANALARRLVDHLSGAAEVLILDMEAGVEHLGRGTTRTTEVMLVVVEPSLKSLETAKQIKKLGGDLGIGRIFSVVNKFREGGEGVVRRLEEEGMPVLAVLPHEEAVLRAELLGKSVFDLEEGKGFFSRMVELSKVLEEKAA
ncbi:MAG: AAA family ATPase [Candidatus Hadarchaeales archaeon]